MHTSETILINLGENTREFFFENSVIFLQFFQLSLTKRNNIFTQQIKNVGL